MPAVSAALAVMIFIVEPGGCTRGPGDPGHGLQRAGAGVHHRHPGVLAAQRGDRGALHRGHDRRRHRLAGQRLGARQHPPAGQQLAARACRPAGSRRSRSSPSRPTLAFERIALVGVQAPLAARDRSQRADDLLGHVGDRRGAVGPLGQRRAVAGQQRRPRWQVDVALEVLAGAQAREQQRAGQADSRRRAAADQRYVERLAQRAPQLGGDHHPHRDDPVAGAADVLGPAPRAGWRSRPRWRAARRRTWTPTCALGGRVQEAVHRRVVGVLPGGHVAGHGVALGAPGGRWPGSLRPRTRPLATATIGTPKLSMRPRRTRRRPAGRGVLDHRNAPLCHLSVKR